MKRILIPLLVCGLFACSKKDTEKPTPTEQPTAVAQITAYLESVDSLSEFAIAFKKISITEAQASGGLTVFAPGNAAIGSYNAGGRTTGDDLPDSLVKDHIVPGKFKIADLTNGKKLTTLSGKVLTVTVVGGHIYINNIEIIVKDNTAGTEIVHIIAGILSDIPSGANITVYDALQWSVDNRSGLPAAGAIVKLYVNAQAYSSGTAVHTATTDANGVAHFTGVAEGNYLVVVTKGTLSNVWPDGNGHTMVAYDTLFQSTQEINAAPHMSGAVPGDFRFWDLNQDGVIDANDKSDAPLRIVSFKADSMITDKLLIGYPQNHLMKPIKTAAEAFISLTGIARQIGLQQKQLVMADGFMSDDMVCATFTAWCTFDNFTFAASNSTIANIWGAEYSSIQQLNRIIYSLPTMTGDTTVVAAQARGLRAYAYLQLVTYFGELPINTELVMPANIGRSSLSDTYDFIKKELTIALATLPVNAPSAAFRHLTKGGAKALLARLALDNNDFIAAKTYASEVIGSGKYALAADTGKIFIDTVGAEILWDLSYINPTDFTQYFLGRPFCPIARYSEMYLIVAEADIALGDISHAASYINLIRDRDDMVPTAFANPDEARAGLNAIRKIEFNREGLRFPSLVRWGLATQTLSAKGYQSRNSKLPIPSNVIERYPNIFQNVGY